MNIMILGAGAMGALVGGYLSRRNQVWLVDVDAERVRQIEQKGVRVREQDGSVGLFHPHAVIDSAGLPEMDLVIVFVKAMYTLSALQDNQVRIGPRTYLMTLQNGAGHEARLLRFADEDHVIIGSTQHNSSVIENGFVNHGGGGKPPSGCSAAPMTASPPSSRPLRTAVLPAVRRIPSRRRSGTSCF